MSYIKSWTPGKYKAELKKELASKGEFVGKFVEVEARRRLAAISDPDWGRGYRQQIVAPLITSVVEEKANEVVIKVGVQQAHQWNEKKPDSTNYYKYFGYYIETGTSKRAAHPWLRPAVFENAGKIVGLFEK